MKLTIFQADKGDCLLLTGADGKTILVDGGMRESFSQHVAPNLDRYAPDGIDLVYVSHIDQDHIAGILQLMDDEVDWRVFDFQRQSGNKNYPEPGHPRPPKIRALWHNAFKDQVQDNGGAIEEQLVANMKILNLDAGIIGEDLAQKAKAGDELLTSIRQGLVLSSRVSPAQLSIPVNEPFNGGVVFAKDQPESHAIGGMKLAVIGPFPEDLEKLRKEWNDWLRKNKEAVEEINSGALFQAEGLSPEEAQLLKDMLDEGQLVFSSMLALASELGRRELVTTPNLASIMLLAEEAGKTVLLTGDGHADDILKGLRLQKKLDNEGRIHVDVLKVQHHGSEHNIHQEFCNAVTADHYVFCGNGAHENPDLDVLQLIIDSRLAPDVQNPNASRPFKFWFNSSSKVAGSQANREHMQKVEDLVQLAASRSKGQMRRRFLTRGSLLTLSL